jgi:hypothetical protein
MNCLHAFSNFPQFRCPHNLSHIDVARRCDCRLAALRPGGHPDRTAHRPRSPGPCPPRKSLFRPFLGSPIPRIRGQAYAAVTGPYPRTHCERARDSTGLRAWTDSDSPPAGDPAVRLLILLRLWRIRTAGRAVGLRLEFLGQQLCLFALSGVSVDPVRLPRGAEAERARSRDSARSRGCAWTHSDPPLAGDPVEFHAFMDWVHSDPPPAGDPAGRLLTLLRLWRVRTADRAIGCV